MIRAVTATGDHTRIETSRLVAASPAAVFEVLCDPQGHVAIDATGMLQDADGERVTATGDRFVVHMDREPLGDLPEMGRYEVEVTIRDLEPDRTPRLRPRAGLIPPRPDVRRHGLGRGQRWE